MFKKNWFRFLAWSTAIAFFFITAMAFACLMAPPPHQDHITKWMEAMGKTMMISLMGIAMHSNSPHLNIVLDTSVKLLPVFGFLGLGYGLVNLMRGKIHEK